MLPKWWGCCCSLFFWTNKVMPLHTFDWKRRDALVHYLTGTCFSYYTGVFIQLIRLEAVDQIFKTKLITGDFYKRLFINPQDPATIEGLNPCLYWAVPTTEAKIAAFCFFSPFYCVLHSFCMHRIFIIQAGCQAGASYLNYKWLRWKLMNSKVFFPLVFCLLNLCCTEPVIKTQSLAHH